MGTWLHLFVKHDNHQEVASFLKELAGTGEAEPCGDKELDNCYSLILEDEQALPSYLVTEDMKNGWVRVHLNSFSKLPDWVKMMSAQFRTQALQIIGQSTSDYYYLLLFEDGVFRRELEGFGDNPEEYIDRGELFPFESAFFPGEDEYGFANVRFGQSDLENFCNGLGFELFSDPVDRNYYLVKQDVIGKTLTEKWEGVDLNISEMTFPEAGSQQASGAKRPWWKFW
ncbi:hypothetical protein [Chitinophaga barathri]|uniref:Uncharacterized protein n=1 Tax=Chitinophaga barathri TaxID=1647451 RepID=A0A3N4MNP8_9BACT|nr:hypothetical protein [Chitinophaga barathri]RPD41690.1 hypothetical protein EG028_05850 [Chitinophaga barathri]